MDSNLHLDDLLSIFEQELIARERSNTQPSQQGRSIHTQPFSPVHDLLLLLSALTSLLKLTMSADHKQLKVDASIVFVSYTTRCQNCQERLHTSNYDSSVGQNQHMNSLYSTESGQNSKIPASQPIHALLPPLLPQQVVFLQTASAVIQ